MGFKNYTFVLFTLAFLSCQQDSNSLTELYSLPKKLKEINETLLNHYNRRKMLTL